LIGTPARLADLQVLVRKSLPQKEYEFYWSIV
jgi:hypothetical protein